jgi:DNA-binding transcriptional regulator LsrR (DeoR family)
MDLDDERSIYLARIASLYYDHKKSQQEIAEEFGVSRSAVSRLVTEAHKKGIVEVIVHYPWRTCPHLEQELVTTFNLKATRVLVREEKSYEEMVQGLGVLAAQYLDTILHDGMIVGISWGTALYQMIKAMRWRHLPGVEVIQVIGATDAQVEPTDGPILARLLSNRLGGSVRYLHAPLIVENEAARDSLLQDRHIRETIARARQADILLVGIGTTNPELYSLLRAGYVDLAEAQAIRSAGAAGDICGQHYSLSGEWLDIDINRRAICLELAALANSKGVIGVVGGSRKGAAILGALRGRYLDVLITDDQAAQKVLALNQIRMV